MLNLVTSLIFSIVFAHAHQQQQIIHMSEVHNFLSQPVTDTLVVFDIDNTLLKMTKPLGGDAWYTWQENILKGGATEFSVAQDIDFSRR
jgi:hypothetical protein